MEEEKNYHGVDAATKLVWLLQDPLPLPGAEWVVLVPVW